MRVAAVIFGLLSAFFIFYTVRLFAVTGFLQRIRPGGQGAYIGAIVFPVLAIALGWLAVRCWRRGVGSGTRDST
jgi:hypothetical protein